jgi:hypothetical protein
MESHLRAIIEEFDNSQCDLDGCDQGLHNYLLYSGRLLLRNNGKGDIGVADQKSDQNKDSTSSLSLYQQLI